MDRVREGIEESEEVGKVIAELGASRVDEAEVEEEFDELLRAADEEERQKKEMERIKQEQAAKEKALQEKAQKENEKNEKVQEEEGLVEEMKIVSLDPSPKETPQTESPIPA